MRVLILGAAGMVGRRLAEALIAAGELGGRAITALDAFDVVEAALPPAAGSLRVTTTAGDIADRDTVEALVAQRPEVIFHLAAIVSGEAEADFDKGYRINLDGTRHLFEAVRGQGAGYCPRLVCTSSIGVFGAPYEDPITDTYIPAPLTSYGTQKMIGELLLNDYTRKGFMDGVGIRLPTIVVRPGKPNKAASSFFSGIIREPLAGMEADLPVGEDVRHWVASPAAAVGFLLHAGSMDAASLGPRRCLTMPGLSVTVGEMIAALRDVAGDEVAGLIRRRPDPVIAGIVAGWPRDFRADRARAAGFRADPDFPSIVRAHIEDERRRASAA